MSYPSYPQSGGYPQPQTQPGNGLAIAGMVCGIVGLVLANLILGPLAIIFGAIGWNRANKGARHKGQAIAGVVLGILDIIVLIVLLAAVGSHSYFYYKSG